MPAGDGTLSLMICPGGLASALLPQGASAQDSMGMPVPQTHQNSGHGATSGHGAMEAGYCVFTTGFSSAPPPPLVAPFFVLLACLGIVLTRVAAPAGIRLVHIPQARAPPAV